MSECQAAEAKLAKQQLEQRSNVDELLRQRAGLEESFQYAEHQQRLSQQRASQEGENLEEVEDSTCGMRIRHHIPVPTFILTGTAGVLFSRPFLFRIHLKGRGCGWPFKVIKRRGKRRLRLTGSRTTIKGCSRFSPKISEESNLPVGLPGFIQEEEVAAKATAEREHAQTQVSIVQTEREELAALAT